MTDKQRKLIEMVRDALYERDIPESVYAICSGRNYAEYFARSDVISALEAFFEDKR